MIDVEALVRRVALVEMERDDYRGALQQICRSPKSAQKIARGHLDTYGSLARDLEKVLERAEKIKTDLKE